MDNFALSLKNEVYTKLDELDIRQDDILTRAKEGVALLEDSIERMKAFVSGYTFKGEQEEIMFFKEIKPRLSSNLIFYRQVYLIEINRPKGGSVVQLEYLRGELDKITRFFEENKPFYRYLRSGDCSMDAHYFLRGKPSLEIHTDSFYFERDSGFSTNCDFMVAQILANDLIESHLVMEIDKLEGKSNGTGACYAHPKVRLTWTGKKIFLIELIYALHEIGFINGGRISLKLLISAFERIFNVELGNVSRGLSDLRIREQPARCLDELKKFLLRRLNRDDEDDNLEEIINVE